MGLITILPGAEVDANDLDFNFKTLEQQISAGLEEINNLVDHTTYSLTALQNQIVDNKNTTDGQNSSLTESLNALNKANNSKLDTNLSNISNEAYDTIYSKLTMNANAGVSVASGWTADKNGWLSLWGRSGEGSYSAWLINNKEVFRNDQSSGGGRAGRLDTRSVAFIAKGQVLTKAGGASSSATFYPCLSGN